MRRRLPVLLLLAGALAGCGERTPSDEEQVRDLLAAFARAVEARDYAKLCDEVLAPKLLEGLQGIGLPCEVALRNSLGQVENPRLTVGGVRILGDDKATAEVRTSAVGQPASSDTVALERVEGDWKVSDLASGVGPDASPSG